MFQETYKSAYGKLVPGEITQEKILAWMETAQKEDKKNALKSRKAKIYRNIFYPIGAAACILCLVVFLGVPAAATNIPEFYGVLQNYAPGLLDYMIPVQKTDTKEGIIMNLEAVYVNGNTAEAVVSFTDDGSGDYIRGEADMYDSYHLKSFSGESNVGGCSFIQYDPQQDKAYFQVDLISSDGTFDQSRMEFHVYKLLTDCQSFTEEIPMDGVIYQCDTKSVKVSGRSGRGEESSALETLKMSGDTIDPRPEHKVLDIPLDEVSPDTMEITGMVYMDGILRVQLCRGNLKEADRHMYVYIKDGADMEIHPDLSVMWQEEVNGEKLTMEEFYFVISEARLKECALLGEGEIRSGCIKGDWSIIFEVE